jgi:hypothetical protein
VAHSEVLALLIHLLNFGVAAQRGVDDREEQIGGKPGREDPPVSEPATSQGGGDIYQSEIIMPALKHHALLMAFSVLF